MADQLMYEIVHRTTEHGRKFWDTLDDQTRAHLTETVQQARYFDIPGVTVPNAPEREPLKDAAYWMTSEAAEAVRWRESASFEAIQEMTLQAIHQPEYFSMPAQVIENPPLVREVFFNVPRESVPPKPGTYFTIPVEE